MQQVAPLRLDPWAVVGSTLPPIYYGFYTSAFYQCIYLICLLSLGAVVFGYTSPSSPHCFLCPVSVPAVCRFTRFDFFYSPPWRMTRILVFVALGMISVVPLMHILWYHNFNQLSLSLWFGVVKMGACHHLTTCHLPTTCQPSMLSCYRHGVLVGCGHICIPSSRSFLPQQIRLLLLKSPVVACVCRTCCLPPFRLRHRVMASHVDSSGCGGGRPDTVMAHNCPDERFAHALSIRAFSNLCQSISF